jgi:hypothetical protein
MKIQEIREKFSNSLLFSSGLARRPVSVGNINPGDLFIFAYDPLKGDGYQHHYRATIIVSTRRGSGYFRSSKGNMLISCYEISHLGPDGIDVLLNQLYKKRKVADYYKISRALDRYLGESSFKTFNLSRIRNLYEVEIKK